MIKDGRSGQTTGCKSPQVQHRQPPRPRTAALNSALLRNPIGPRSVQLLTRLLVGPAALHSAAHSLEDGAQALEGSPQAPNERGHGC